MSTYIFILGKDPELSLAELTARFPSADRLLESDQFAVREMAEEVDQTVFDTLGGQIKVGKVFGKVSKKDLIAALADHLAEDHTSGKLNYAVSVYGMPENQLKQLLTDLKKEFKERGVSSRFANQAFLNLSIAQYKGLRTEGEEVLVCKAGDDYHLAQVVAAQDIDAYSQRDYEKPFRDMRIGMLPPKLAQIMINLTGLTHGTLWDPFCGGGVMVMEGALMGYRMLGSDISPEALQGAEQNLEWLSGKFGLKRGAVLFQHDATHPLPDEEFDGIVCEGYLGHPQSRPRSEIELRPMMAQLSLLYRKFFVALDRGNFTGPVVIGLPFFKTRDGDIALEKVIHDIEQMGFQKELELTYARPDQLVGRHILRFRKNNF